MEKNLKLSLPIKLISILFLISFSSLCLSHEKLQNRLRVGQFNLDNAVRQSDFILEGKVIKKECLINKDSVIYTSAYIRVSKIFKGDNIDSLIEIIYIGGYYDGLSIPILEISDGYALSKGQEGIFLLKTNNTNVSLNRSMESFEPISYLISYNFGAKKGDPYVAITSGTVYYNVEKDLFQKIESLTGRKRKVLRPNMFGG